MSDFKLMSQELNFLKNDLMSLDLLDEETEETLKNASKLLKKADKMAKKYKKLKKKHKKYLENSSDKPFD